MKLSPNSAGYAQFTSLALSRRSILSIDMCVRFQMEFFVVVVDSFCNCSNSNSNGNEMNTWSSARISVIFRFHLIYCTCVSYLRSVAVHVAHVICLCSWCVLLRLLELEVSTHKSSERATEWVSDQKRRMKKKRSKKSNKLYTNTKSTYRHVLIECVWCVCCICFCCFAARHIIECTRIWYPYTYRAEWHIVDWNWT